MIKKESFEERMKTYCDLKEKNIVGANAVASAIAKSHPEIQDYFDSLGGQRIKSLNYKEANLKRELRVNGKVEDCYKIIRKKVTPKTFISSKDAKKIIADLYSEFGILACPKGSDLSKWFDINPTDRR